MKSAIIFDCEFLCVEGSLGRHWCGASDPDPVIAQIGAVKLGLEDDFQLLATHKAYVRPIDRFGKGTAIDPFFTRLTGITEDDIRRNGVALEEALAGIDAFADGARLWSWGRDELHMMAISCYVAGIRPSIPAHRFDNAAKLLVAAGMPVEDLARTPSSKLADYYGVAHPPLRGHDALDDALSIAYTLQHLLRSQILRPDAFALTKEHHET